MLKTNHGVQAVTAFVEEAIEEAMGISPRKWALLLVAVAVGAIGALWLTRRARQAEPATTTAGDAPS
jgi:hypothetical protein